MQVYQVLKRATAGWQMLDFTQSTFPHKYPTQTKVHSYPQPNPIDKKTSGRKTPFKHFKLPQNFYLLDPGPRGKS